jgi:hypothetical protein
MLRVALRYGNVAQEEVRAVPLSDAARQELLAALAREQRDERLADEGGVPPDYIAREHEGLQRFFREALPSARIGRSGRLVVKYGETAGMAW